MTAEAVAKFHKLNERRQQLGAAMRDVSERWSAANTAMRTARDALITGNVDPTNGERFNPRFESHVERLKLLTDERQAAYDKLKADADRLLAERDAVQVRVATLSQVVGNCAEELRQRGIKIERRHNVASDPGPGAGIFTGATR